MPRKKTITKGQTTVNVNVYGAGDAKQRKRRPRRRATRRVGKGQSAYGAVAPTTLYHGGADANIPALIGSAIARGQEQGQQMWYGKQLADLEKSQKETASLTQRVQELTNAPTMVSGQLVRRNMPISDVLDVRQAKAEQSLALPENPPLITPVEDTMSIASIDTGAGPPKSLAISLASRNKPMIQAPSSASETEDIPAMMKGVIRDVPTDIENIFGEPEREGLARSTSPFGTMSEITQSGIGAQPRQFAFGKDFAFESDTEYQVPTGKPEKKGPYPKGQPLPHKEKIAQANRARAERIRAEKQAANAKAPIQPTERSMTLSGSDVETEVTRQMYR